MNLLTATNYSDNKFKLIVFCSSSGSALKHTVKSSKQFLRVWNPIMKQNFKNRQDLPKLEVYFSFYYQLDSRL